MRRFGYGSEFQPTLENSRKKRIREYMGEDYIRARDLSELAMEDNRTRERAFREDN